VEFNFCHFSLASMAHFIHQVHSLKTHLATMSLKQKVSLR
jgi:hypothetical protein